VSAGRRSHLARTLARARATTLLSQRDFADQYGFSERSVRAWEAGETIPPLRVLRQYAHEFDLDVAELGRDRRTAVEARERQRRAAANSEAAA
jgi:transcriptional regulator with XRE-family HTH domain